MPSSTLAIECGFLIAWQIRVSPLMESLIREFPYLRWTLDDAPVNPLDGSSVKDNNHATHPLPWFCSTARLSPMCISVFGENGE